MPLVTAQTIRQNELFDERTAVCIWVESDAREALLRKKGLQSFVDWGILTAST